MQELKHFEYQDDEADVYQENIREHIASVIAQEIDSGNTGAVVTSDPDAVDGYYLVKWSGNSYKDQDTGELVCDGYFLNPVGRAQKWYTPSALPSRSVVKHVMLANLLMEGITDSNQPPNTSNIRQAAAKGALKISMESDDFIFGEIYLRDKWEDPEYEDEDD